MANITANEVSQAHMKYGLSAPPQRFGERIIGQIVTCQIVAENGGNGIHRKPLSCL